jgi:hypothetical protein
MATQVKQAADELLSQLQRSEAVLDAVAHKLEEEAATRFSRGASVSCCWRAHGSPRCTSPLTVAHLLGACIGLLPQINPLQLAKRLRKLSS